MNYPFFSLNSIIFWIKIHPVFEKEKKMICKVFHNTVIALHKEKRLDDIMGSTCLLKWY